MRFTPPTEDFNIWFDKLVEFAVESYPRTASYIHKAAFMYEDYWEAGYTPEEAFRVEWLQ